MVIAPDRKLGLGCELGIEAPHRARCVDRAVLHEQPDELLEERRVAAGLLDGGLRGLVGDGRNARQEVAKHLLGVIGLAEAASSRW